LKKDWLRDSTLTELLHMIYKKKRNSTTMEFSKVSPIFSKGAKIEVENYRPIDNQCSLSEIIDKLILKQIHYLEEKNKLHITGVQQHGFKKATVGLSLQYHISCNRQ
jgi:hypothetical protein